MHLADPYLGTQEDRGPNPDQDHDPIHEDTAKIDAIQGVDLIAEAVHAVQLNLQREGINSKEAFKYSSRDRRRSSSRSEHSQEKRHPKSKSKSVFLIV